MKKLVIGLFIFSFIFLASGCSLLGGNKDQKTPDGAWNLFVDHLKNKKYNDAWNILTEESKKDFTDVMTMMTTLLANVEPEVRKELIETFKQEVGTSDIKNPQDLLKAEFGELDESMLTGAEIASKEIKGDVCTISTKAGQTFEMRKKGDLWYLYYAEIVTAKKDFGDALTAFGIADPTKAVAAAPGTPVPAPAPVVAPAPTPVAPVPGTTPGIPKAPAPIKAGR